MTKNCNHIFDVFIKRIMKTKTLRITKSEGWAMRTICSICGPRENKKINKKDLAVLANQSRRQLNRSLKSLRDKSLIDYKDSFKEWADFRVELRVMESYISEPEYKVGHNVRPKPKSDILADFVPKSDILADLPPPSRTFCQGSKELEGTNKQSTTEMAAQEKVEESKFTSHNQDSSQSEIIEVTKMVSTQDMLNVVNNIHQSVKEGSKNRLNEVFNGIVGGECEVVSNDSIIQSMGPPETLNNCQNNSSS